MFNEERIEEHVFREVRGEVKVTIVFILVAKGTKIRLALGGRGTEEELVGHRLDREESALIEVGS